MYGRCVYLETKSRKPLEYNRPTYLCFINLQKAFHQIKVKDVIRLLYSRQISLDIIKTVEEIYKGNKIQAKIGHLIEPLDVDTDIRRSDSLNPLLFSLIMDEVINNVNNNKTKNICLIFIIIILIGKYYFS